MKEKQTANVYEATMPVGDQDTPTTWHPVTLLHSCLENAKRATEAMGMRLDPKYDQQPPDPP